MTTKTDNFVLASTDALWATIYKKRRLARYHALQQFDKAAQINQDDGRNPQQCLDLQDEHVKSIFRDFVDYVVMVCTSKASLKDN